MEALYDAAYNGVPFVAPLTPLFFLGALLLGIALYRARTVPRWAAVLMSVSPLAQFTVPQDNQSLVLTAIVAVTPMLVALAGCASGFLRRS